MDKQVTIPVICDYKLEGYDVIVIDSKRKIGSYDTKKKRGILQSVIYLIQLGEKARRIYYWGI